MQQANSYRTLRVFFDVDDTIIYWIGNEPVLRNGTREVFERIRADGHALYLWSGNGVRWDIVELFDLGSYVVNCFEKPKYRHMERLGELGIPFKPDFVVDDYQEVVDAFVGFRISRFTNLDKEDLELFRTYDAIVEFLKAE